MNLLRPLLLSVFLIWFQPSFSQLVADFSPESFEFTTCPGDIEFYDQSTGNPTSWLWDFGDNSTSVDQNPTHQYVTPGTYSVTLIISDGLNYDTLTRIDLILVSPPGFPAQFLAEKDYSAHFTVLFNIATFFGPFATCLWDYGDQQSSTTCDLLHTHTYSLGGNYWACLTINDAGCISTFCDSVNADSSTCAANFNLYADTIPQHYLVVNRASGTFPLTYIWDWGDGAIDSVPYPSHTYDTAGYYTICLTIRDSNGCRDTFCNSYNLLKTSSAVIEVNVIPPLSTGNIEIFDAKPSAFPNPASDYLMLELSNPTSEGEFKIFNTVGQLEVTSRITGQKTNIDISRLTSGIYILEARTNNNISRQKFIKE